MAIEEQKSKKEYVDEIEDDLKHLTMPKQNLLKIPTTIARITSHAASSHITAEEDIREAP